MPIGIRMIIIFGTISLFCALIISLALGGGFAPGFFPPNEPVELKLIPLERPTDAGEAPAPSPTPRMEIPEKFRAPDLMPPITYQDRDGRWQFRD